MRNYIIIFLILSAIWGCMRGDKNENLPPNTFISLESINRVGENRLNSNVRLSWFGTDKDGYVVGFEFSFDRENWFNTTKNDSTFRFSIDAGSDTMDQDFWVRAIDNEGAKDPDPAYLRIPLRNTPPVASFDNEVGPEDTALVAATFRWRATDLDGDETISQVLMKFNDGDWFPIPSANVITFMLDPNSTSGSGQAQIFSATENNPISQMASDVRVNAENVVYIKAIDIAGAESDVDTSNAFYFKQQNSDNLIICGQPMSVRNVITPYAKNAFNNDCDFIDFYRDQGKYQPKFWAANFGRVLKRYDKLFIYTDIASFTNSATGQSATILVNLSPLIAEFNSNNGKSFVTTILTSSSDFQSLGIGFPIEGVVVSGGQARLTADSSLIPVLSGYPPVSPDGTLTGIVPLVRSLDSEDFYRAQLTPINNWQGDNLIAALRRRNNNVQQVFFATSLHRFITNPTSLQDLFDKIIQDDFDW
ncbi:MAG: hypothetical protein JJU02_15715 [Cryomorphaceae bacterium]|nr:hypothetical protein [Cryomorphaceae bacterium]